MKAKPLPGYVIIEPIEEDEETASGLIIANPQKERPVKGTVRDVGEDWLTEHGTVIKSHVSVGEVVFYRRWSGDEIKLGEISLRVVRFSDVVAKYE